MFLETFRLGCASFGHVTIHSILRIFLYLCGIGCYFSFISFLIYLNPIYFLVRLDKSLSILFIFSKKSPLFV